MPDGFEQILSSHSQITDEGKHHNPVEDGDPRKGDETHTRGDRERNAAQGERCHPSGKRQGYAGENDGGIARSEEHTSELQSLMRISYAVFCLKKKKKQKLETLKNNTHNNN